MTPNQPCNVMDTSLVTMSLTEECTLNEFGIQAGCVHYQISDINQNVQCTRLGRYMHACEQTQPDLLMCFYVHIVVLFDILVFTMTFFD